MSSVEIKDYNVLIDGNAFFELPVKNLDETSEKIIQITNHAGYCTRGDLLDYNYLKEHYKLIAIDLSKQIDLENKDIKQLLISKEILNAVMVLLSSLSLRKVKKQS